MINNGKVERFGSSQLPFSTSDAILAFSLCMAGVPFADERRPCLNIYDEEILNKLGFGGRSLTLKEAAELALKRKKKGHVEYAFARTPDLRRLLKVYSEQQKELATGTGTAAEVTKRILLSFVDNKVGLDEVLIRLACINAKMKTQFMSLWQKVDPIIRVWNKGKNQIINNPDGSTTVRHPGFKLVHLHASEETRKKLKL